MPQDLELNHEKFFEGTHIFLSTIESSIVLNPVQIKMIYISTLQLRGRLSALILISFVVNVCIGKFTEQEKVALAKFKESLHLQPDLLYKDYMQTDSYLLPFLKAETLNVNAANKRLVNTIRWRKDNNIDQVMNETGASTCDTSYPSISDVVDRNGKPVMIFSFGEWDIRKIVLAGKQDHFIRCAMRFLEIMTTKARERIEASDDKEQLSQFVLIVDLNGYNLRQQACVACLPPYLTFLREMETHYPQLIHKIVLINAPTLFERLFQILKAVLTPETQAVISIFGYEKQKWQPALHQLISPEELPQQYGGTKARRSR